LLGHYILFESFIELSALERRPYRGADIMEERRVHKRYAMPLSVKAEFYESGEWRSESMKLVNISRGGACIAYQHPLEAGSIVNLEISDCSSGFVNQLGEWSKVHGDLVSLKVQGQVMRNQEHNEEFQHHYVALQFKSPIKIIGY
jgi:hypothetical protein